MATGQTASAVSCADVATAGFGVIRSAATGAIVASIFFALCRIGAHLPIGLATHMYLRLFTSAEIASGTALAEGVCWSILFGAIAGALIAVVYNSLAPIRRR
ncbi:hypothetical protein MZO42_17580 [Sphingomonas psychrotolerans]|uniref:Threonine/Serine exporter ThrE domain-containing protein n=1 Tax=Sphingomonas psychrotolerans TaxID=1327635 RepID=A0ABU3N7L2_9SPHN|nr:hypothetical protein [Sphingomonas psychrotolerans]MDT8760515.1 hypothetical protein [Sphingomonas psychrotolerans]